MEPLPVISYAQPTPVSAQSPAGDRRLLHGFGLFFIVLGSIAGVIGGIGMLVALVAARPTAISEVVDAVPGLLVWALVVIGLIWTGIGSIRLRRWARAMVLSMTGIMVWVSAITLLVMGFLHMTAPPIVATVQRRSSRGGGGVRARAVASAAASSTDSVEMLVIAAVVFFFGIAAPLTIFLAYSSRRVAAAAEEADTRRSWIDGRPVPAVALALALLITAFAIALLLFNLPPIPLGFASGDAAEARVFLGGTMIVLAVFFAWCAWLIVRLHPLGPWLALLLIAATAGGSIAAMMNPNLRSSFGDGSVTYAPYEIAWYLQLASIRGVITVSAYAIPAALYVLYVRRILRDMHTPTARPT